MYLIGQTCVEKQFAVIFSKKSAFYPGKIRKHVLSWFTCLFVLAASALAQESYIQAHFNSNNGGIQNQVNFMFQDPEGYLWIGSHEGIYRFDGQLFRKWNADSGNNSLLSRTMSYEKQENALKIYGYYAEGLLTNKYFSIRPMAYNKKCHDLLHRISICRDSILKWAPSYMAKGKNALLWPRVYSNGKQHVIVHDNNQLLINNNNQISYWNNIPEPDYAIWDQDTAYLLGNKFVYKAWNKQLIRSAVKIIDRNGQIINDTATIRLIQNKGIYYLIKADRLYRITQFAKGIFTVDLITKSEVFRNNRITDIVESNNGASCFVSTLNDGIFFLNLRKIKTFAPPGPEGSWIQYFNLFSGTITTNTGCLFRYDQQHVPRFVGFTKATTPGFQASNQLTYFVDYDKSLRITDPNGNTIHTIRDKSFIITGITEGPDKTIYLFSHNTIWKMNSSFNLKPVLHSPRIDSSFYIASLSFSRDTIWMAMPLKGVCYFALKTGKSGELPLFRDKEPRYIFNDTLYNLRIICTYGNGMYRIQGTSVTPAAIALENLKFTHLILRDKYNIAWLPTNKGIYALNYSDLLQSFSDNKKTMPYRWFSVNNGLLADEFNGGFQNSGHYNPETGEILLANVKGLVSLNQDDVLELNKFMPAIERVEDLRTGKIHFYMPDRFDRITALKIRLTTPGDVINDEIIEYRFSGNDSSWQIYQNDEIIYTDPGPGQHTIEIRCLSDLRSKSYHSTRFTFYVQPEWYQSFWGRLLILFAGLALISVTYLCVRYYIRNKKRRFELELAKKTRTFNQKILQLDIKERENSMLISVLAHDVKGPIAQINKVMAYLSTNAGVLEPRKLERYLQDVHNSTSGLSDYVYRFLTWFKVRKMNFIEISNIDLSAFVMHIISVAKDLGYSNGLIVSLNDRLSSTLLPGNEILLQILIQNAIENASKHAGATEVNIHLYESADDYFIDITDNGKGMSAESIHRFEQESENTGSVNKDSFKMGLSFMKEIATKMFGEMKLLPGKGLTVHYRFSKKPQPEEER